MLRTQILGHFAKSNYIEAPQSIVLQTTYVLHLSCILFTENLRIIFKMNSDVNKKKYDFPTKYERIIKLRKCVRIYSTSECKYITQELNNKT